MQLVLRIQPDCCCGDCEREYNGVVESERIWNFGYGFDSCSAVFLESAFCWILRDDGNDMAAGCKRQTVELSAMQAGVEMELLLLRHDSVTLLQRGNAPVHFLYVASYILSEYIGVNRNACSILEYAIVG